MSRRQETAGERPLAARLYAHLVDGAFHSGEELARELGLTRSAIWKAAATLRELGTELEAVRNKGYRLSHPGELLDAARIRAQLPRAVRERLRALETTWSIASTNTALLERGFPPVGHGEVLLAEYQSAGKGRRGRTWMAPPGGAICLSLSWTFPAVSQDLGALGLVIGVCAVRALQALGLEGVELKWPNDLLHAGCKLGGILIELRAEAAGPACVVIGLGLNVAVGETLLQQIGATGLVPTDLRHAGLGAARNAVVAALLTAIVQGLGEFERGGLKPFLAEWRDADALRGRPINVIASAGMTKGLARGIDAHGALLVGDCRRHATLYLRGRLGEARLMSIVVVDIGNTRIKWAKVVGGRPGAAHAAAHAKWTAALYRRRIITAGVTGLLVASVAGKRADRELRRAARSARIPILFMAVPRRGAGVSVGYREPWRLGVDRFAAMVGAHHLFRGVPLLVVAVGTALTLDLVGGRGMHFGGAIIPAPQLMVSSLLQETSGIRRRAQGGGRETPRLFARSTRDALEQGARYAAAAIIDRAVDEASRITRARPLVVLTGGQGPLVRLLVRSHCVGVADLTLRGLAVLAASEP